MTFFEKPDDFEAAFIAAGCVIVHSGRFLMVKRSPDESQPNTWALPAGGVEEGESVMDAVIREVKEEADIDLAPSELNLLKKVYIRRQSDEFEFHYYIAKKKDKPEITLVDKENVDYKWMTPREALDRNDIIPDGKACLELLIDVV